MVRERPPERSGEMRFYTVLIASRTFMRAARRAGNTAANMPKTPPTIVKITAQRQGMETTLMKLSGMAETAAYPMMMPSTTPRSAPKTPTMMASHRTIERS